VFRCDDGSFLTAHTKHGGCWKYAYPLLESQWIGKVDATTLGKATHLVKDGEGLEAPKQRRYQIDLS